MRIRSVIAYRVNIPFRKPFGHALQWRSASDAIILAVASETGAVGWGEILPRRYLTGETVDGLFYDYFPEFAQRWLRKSFFSWHDIVVALQLEQQHNAHLAVLAGWEVALLDLAEKEFGIVAADVLGRNLRHELPRGVVIGFDVATKDLEQHCRVLRIRGERHIKVKVGLSDDVRRLEIVQCVFGAELPIRIDANGAWSADDAIDMVHRVRRLHIESIEQPVPAGDLDGMKRVREKTGMSVVADESLCSAADARRIITSGAADVFNIRIGKCGGWLPCLQLVRIAREAGIKCQLGTLVGETGILSKVSEIFGSRVRGFEFLEGKGQSKRLLVQDIVEHDPVASTTFGLGFRISEENLRQWTTSTLTISQIREGVTA